MFIIYCCPNIYHLLLEKNIPHENLYKRPLIIFIDWRFIVTTKSNQNFRFNDAFKYNAFAQKINYPLYIRLWEVCLHYKKNCANGCLIDNTLRGLIFAWIKFRGFRPN